ncbi:hypothetical protein ACKVWC_004153 [Pyricularia oryzae]
MSLFQSQLYPGQALGFLVLGASLHDILTRIKAEPQRFPKIDLAFSQTAPIEEPVVVNLPSNGVRLRFDGPEQRLRLVEVVDFTKIHITFKEANNERDLMRPAAEPTATGPAFKHIYNRFLGPTYDGEFVPGNEGGKDVGTYVLSYPGVAFTFPMAPSAYSPDKDVMSLLSHNGTQVATSMAVFSGDTWAQARDTLWNEALPSLKTFAPLSKGSKDASPDDVTLVRIHGGGKLQLVRKWTGVGDAPLPSTWIILGETTPQDLVAELGPPDAIYRRNEQRMYIHRVRGASSSHGRRPNSGDVKPGSHDNLTDTDMSSANALSTDDGDYDSRDDEDEAVEDDAAGNVAGECFYNYFYLGFDILISTPRVPSQPPPGVEEPQVPRDRTLPSESQDRLVATKMILHGNVPGSYPFNRHRRCRWEIGYLDQPTNSETPFPETEERLGSAWKSTYLSEADAKQRQRGMVLNRGWGDSPGSSIEFLGGWEGEVKSSARKTDAIGADNSTTTLYGYPGLVFEVLRNGFVSALTVF